MRKLFNYPPNDLCAGLVERSAERNILGIECAPIGHSLLSNWMGKAGLIVWEDEEQKVTVGWQRGRTDLAICLVSRILCSLNPFYILHCTLSEYMFDTHGLVISSVFQRTWIWYKTNENHGQNKYIAACSFFVKVLQLHIWPHPNCFFGHWHFERSPTVCSVPYKEHRDWALDIVIGYWVISCLHVFNPKHEGIERG